MAKPFRFKLQKVLEYREQREEQTRADLARAQRAHDDQQRVVRDLEARLAEHEARQGESASDVNMMWLWRQYREALAQDISVARVELSQLELKLQKCRREAIARSRDRKLLEKLKESQARKHHDEEQLREQKENDEMATIRHEPEAL